MESAAPGMTVPIFTGVGVALLTIFDSSGAVDAGATAALAGSLVDLGVEAVLVAGSTGEAASLTPEERAMLVGAVRASLPSTVVVLAGAGAPSALQAVHLTKVVLDAGADAVLALSPPQSSDARRYYALVADAAGGASVLAYHYPGASPPGLPVEVLAELPVQGLKDSSGDVRRLYDGSKGFRRMAVYTGSTNLVLLAGALHCAGVILLDRGPATGVVRPCLPGRSRGPTPARRGRGPSAGPLATRAQAGGLGSVWNLSDSSHGLSSQGSALEARKNTVKAR